MKRAIALGAVCALLALLSPLGLSTPDDPAISGSITPPFLQEEPVNVRDYPVYCDSLTADDGFRFSQECYEWSKYDGFNVAVHRRVLRDQLAADVGRLRDVVRAEITMIALRVPSAAVEKLRATPIILADFRICGGRACYRSWQDILWVEVGPNESGWTYVDYAPIGLNAIFHELAHAYHAQHLPDGYDNDCVSQLHTDATLDGTFEDVANRHPSLNPTDHSGPHHDTAYAMTNREEFFAEMSQAYYVGNSQEPYNRAMLMEWDHDTALAIQEIWEGKRCN
ncbi:MAG: hypothetical protein OXM59_07555 [Gammaproteobacteria bacterium]|nr:hypothetical protein [Gammaproteobacteria bacterium]